MALLPKPQEQDPTLVAMDKAIVDHYDPGRRLYLGMSSIGRPCSRELWYNFRWIKVVIFDAASLKRFKDGFVQEDITAARLNAIPEAHLECFNPETGEQLEFSDFNGHFKGHTDGIIGGILQAPKTPHLWENKAVNDAKFNKLNKLKIDLGEKSALREWDYTYYVQVVMYMEYGGYTRAYTTVSTPGGREYTSVRTNADIVTVQKMKARAKDIIFRDNPPSQIGDETNFQCKFCDYLDICHQKRQPDANCRTCLHSTPEETGGWSCAKHLYKDMDFELQEAGCPDHLYLPSLIDAEQIDASVEENWVLYRLPDGSEWRNG